MPMLNVTIRTLRRWLAGAVVALALALPSLAHAQVVVIANGSPITELDIQQRLKLVATSSNTKPTRQEIINDLIDDRLKIAKAKVYGLEVSDAEVDQAFESMAKRQRISVQQFSQAIERAGIQPSTIKARLRAELTWNQLVRGKYGSSLQVGESDIAKILRDRNTSESATVGYVYTLYPITIVVGRGLSEGAIEAKRREAENLRSRFLTCNEGLPLARALRDVAVREPISRSSADLAPQLRELLSSIEVGRLTAPEVTEQGLQMFALCAKKESSEDTPAKREAREQLYSKRFESEAKKFLDEIRKQAMIEYK
ncbi:MAG: SurA N-terminal domain-containing protein [Rhizobiales bacterium]|nr:SurA N-terminal domain-containing protein [Hyphomicrobiales bacterium]